MAENDKKIFDSSKMLSEEALRLRGIYDALDPSNLEASLSTILLITNESSYTANREMANILHIQGKNRYSIPGGASSDLKASPLEEVQDSFLDELFKASIINLMKRYLEVPLKKNDAIRIKTLIVYLSVQNLFSILYELDFPQEYLELVDGIMADVLAEKKSILQDLIDFYKSKELYQLANLVKSEGFKVLEVKASIAIERFFFDYIKDFDDAEVKDALYAARAQILNMTTSPKVYKFCELVSLSESTYRKNKKILHTELINYATPEEIENLNKLLQKL